MLTALALIVKLMLYIGALVTIGILLHFSLGIQQKLKGLRAFVVVLIIGAASKLIICLLYTSPSPRDATLSRMPSSA